MAQIDLDQEITDFLLANERLTGQSPSEYIRGLLSGGVKPRKPRAQIRKNGTDLALFLQILTEVHAAGSEQFSAVTSVRGRTRIYFSKDPKKIEASGRSTFPVVIPGTGWWVTSNISTGHKRKILEKVFRIIGCSAEDRHRWLVEFTGLEPAMDESNQTEEDDGFFKI